MGHPTSGFRLPVSCFLIHFLSACASSPPLPADSPLDAPPADRIRHYTIWLAGSRIGTATETETYARDASVRLRRDEDLRFARGDAVVELRSAIVIDADAALAPTRVTWTERGQAPKHEEAYRDGAGWHASTGAALPDAAIPGELAELIVRRDGRFAGPVFLPARGFVAGVGRIDAVDRARFVARLAFATSTASAEATIDVGSDGAPVRVVDGEGVIELRATAEQASAPFPIVDLIAATALPITGDARAASAAPRAIILAGELAPPALPGQLARAASADGVELVLDAQLPGALPPGVAGADRTAEIDTLVDAVRARIAPDLAAGPGSVDDAAAATSGDCTTFALAYASIATRAGIATRVVTGLRVDGARLVRHRWAVSWTGRAWIAVDAAYGAVPAGGDLVGLAVHDADDAGLVAGEAALARVHAARWAESAAAAARP